VTLFPNPSVNQWSFRYWNFHAAEIDFQLLKYQKIPLTYNGGWISGTLCGVLKFEG